MRPLRDCFCVENKGCVSFAVCLLGLLPCLFGFVCLFVCADWGWSQPRARVCPSRCRRRRRRRVLPARCAPRKSGANSVLFWWARAPTRDRSCRAIRVLPCRSTRAKSALTTPNSKPAPKSTIRIPTTKRRSAIARRESCTTNSPKDAKRCARKSWACPQTPSSDPSRSLECEKTEFPDCTKPTQLLFRSSDPQEGEKQAQKQEKKKDFFFSFLCLFVWRVCSYTAYSDFPALDIAPNAPPSGVSGLSELSRLEQFHQWARKKKENFSFLIFFWDKKISGGFGQPPRSDKRRKNSKVRSTHQRGWGRQKKREKESWFWKTKKKDFLSEATCYGKVILQEIAKVRKEEEGFVCFWCVFVLCSLFRRRQSSRFKAPECWEEKSFWWEHHFLSEKNLDWNVCAFKKVFIVVAAFIFFVLVFNLMNSRQ